MLLDFSNQRACLSLLRTMAENNKRSIVVEGPSGSGKTLVAKQYARMLNVPDVVVVPSKVQDIKEAFYKFSQVDNNVVLIIENLDAGVPSCAYVLLKSMEEPSDNLYVVVTCSNKYSIPDTVLSRSMVVRVSSPSREDLNKYAQSLHSSAFEEVKTLDVWQCVTSFALADYVCSLSRENLSYLSLFDTLSVFDSPVSSCSWKLSHFPDNSEADSSFIVSYILYKHLSNPHVVGCCVRCLDQLKLKRIAPYLTLTRLAFDLKYCE